MVPDVMWIMQYTTLYFIHIFARMLKINQTRSTIFLMYSPMISLKLMVSGDVGDHILNVLQLVAMVLKQEQGSATIHLLPEEAVVALEIRRN